MMFTTKQVAVSKANKHNAGLWWIILSLIALSCGQQQSRLPQLLHGKVDTTVQDTAKFHAVAGLSFSERTYYDSLFMDSLQPLIMTRAATALKEGVSSGYLTSLREPSGETIFATWKLGHLFDSKRTHLLIKWFRGNYPKGYLSYLDIFIVKAKHFQKIVRDSADLNCIGDTLMDVNGDGYKDFIISYYSGVGCCPRDARTGYLYRADKGDFVTESFFNPTFLPEKRLVYQSDYGQPGFIALDKYEWEGLKLVRKESVFPTKDTNAYQVAKDYTFTLVKYPGKRSEIIKDVPEEYKRLELYEYFMSYKE